MNREQFIGYVKSRAEVLKIPLHDEGELLGLPRACHQALAVAYLLDALGQPAPSGDELRTWYGEELASPETARWVYSVVGSLRNQDLEKLNLEELLKFWLRFQSWSGFASGLANDLKRK
jgi:hypothetical protein